MSISWKLQPKWVAQMSYLKFAAFFPNVQVTKVTGSPNLGKQKHCIIQQNF